MFYYLTKTKHCESMEILLNATRHNLILSVSVIVNVVARLVDMSFGGQVVPRSSLHPTHSFLSGQ